MATYQIINGESAETLKQFPDNHFDSVVCDPPYGISFLGKDWDSKKATTSTLVGVQNLPSGMKHTSLADDLAFQHWLTDIYKECLRVLKPGGYLLAFAAARMSHHNAMAAQMAGFEIRDQVMWLYASGFPKSQDVGKSIQRSIGVKETKKVTDNGRGRMANTLAQGLGLTDAGFSGVDTVCTDDAAKEWSGWGSALKPAHEPICMARKPLKQTIAKNCQQYGTGALNIDATRIPTTDVIINSVGTSVTFANINAENNVSGVGTGNSKIERDKWEQSPKGRFPSNVIGEVEGYQKFFYCPKVSRKERHCGFELPKALTGQVKGCYAEDGTRMAVGFDNAEGDRGNHHPTVKPVALMDYLIRLVTKPGGKVLDPFNGSGSTGCAAVKAGYEYVGIDLDPKYCEISRKRIDAWCQTDNNYDELFTGEDSALK